MSKIDLKGNILMLRCDTWGEVLAELVVPRKQVSIAQIKEEDGVPEHYLVSRPLEEWERGSYAFLYKRKEKGSINPSPDDDGPRAA